MLNISMLAQSASCTARPLGFMFCASAFNIAIAILRGLFRNPRLLSCDSSAAAKSKRSSNIGIENEIAVMEGEESCDWYVLMVISFKGK